MSNSSPQRWSGKYKLSLRAASLPVLCSIVRSMLPCSPHCHARRYPTALRVFILACLRRPRGFPRAFVSAGSCPASELTARHFFFDEWTTIRVDGT